MPDGFIHCYGPLFTRVRDTIARGALPADNTLLKFLEAGIIIPALREGYSLKENFCKRVRGILPGERL